MERSNVPTRNARSSSTYGGLLGGTRRVVTPGVDGAPGAVIRPSFYKRLRLQSADR